MDGILIIDKPKGLTSHDVVARLRRVLGLKRIGHTGTLDPFATGVLVTLVGKATRLAQFLDKDRKEYEAVVRFGYETDTGDRTGEYRVSNHKLRDFSEAELETVLSNFRGEIEQTPPMYSAKKVGGKKLYELARRGIEIERQPVKVTIYELEKLNARQNLPIEDERESEESPANIHDVSLRVVCSAGTYIRTLAEDIGKTLGVGAHLAELRRTRAGNLDLAKAVTVEELEFIVESGKFAERLISMNEAVSYMPQVVLCEEEITDTRHGKKLAVAASEFAERQTIRMIDAEENLLAIGFYESAEKSVQPKVVLI